MAEALKVLGLAYRARKLVLGEEVLNQIKKVKLLFIASDISEKSRIRFTKKCHYYNIRYIDEACCDTVRLSRRKQFSQFALR